MSTETTQHTGGATRADRIGFIGLGQMGMGMARNLCRAGLPLVACDIDPAKTAEIAGEGAAVAESPADVAAAARIVITMVDTDAQSRDVIVGPGGIVGAARPGDIVICMSTIDPLSVREMHDTLAAQGIGMIEAPVVGMIRGATEGTLRAYVGGAAETLDACRHVLDPMTREIIHVGGIGQGLAMKLINNMLYHVSSIAAIEAMMLGHRAGLDPKVMKEVIGRSTGNSAAFQYRADRIIRRDFDGVRLDISVKDMELELSLGKSFGVPLLLPALALQVFRMGSANGMGSEDATGIIRIYEDICRTMIDSGAAEDQEKGDDA
ncbi:NAD(P)-dependent oxidoreductase [Celeribacter indicus]|uniref:3-hydroxyisobutyrate dehydrogenase n=1 Tax=Celeribacter indicus TaxID=1208324 RepID=A0A0B5E0D4_9RHOB|nr:NAD(P)-dependent oxidoreductase [Celeribacter indicus]AJE49143.1 3-hydroxyisobutyrate dehydrogenase [Celeribacter indicus]SDX17481.1 3-hydroxyisobutyrate dehydrogenase [Celeribacter indicus]